MKMQESLTYLLIIGSLSLTTAQIQLRNEEEYLYTLDMDAFQKNIEYICEQNGGSDALEIFKRGPGRFRDCVSPIVDVTLLRQEIEAARRQGELNTVFKRYCKGIPLIKQCARDFSNILAPCLDSKLKNTMKEFLNFTNTALDFACQNEGDYTAMFVGAGGVECVQKKLPEIFGYARQRTSQYNTNPTEDCVREDEFSDYIVSLMSESCPDPTAADFVDSMLTYQKINSPCESLLKKHAAENAGKGVATTSVVNLLLIMTFAMLISF